MNIVDETFALGRNPTVLALNADLVELNRLRRGSRDGAPEQHDQA